MKKNFFNIKTIIATLVFYLVFLNLLNLWNSSTFDDIYTIIVMEVICTIFISSININKLTNFINPGDKGYFWQVFRSKMVVTIVFLFFFDGVLVIDFFYALIGVITIDPIIKKFILKSIKSVPQLDGREPVTNREIDINTVVRLNEFDPIFSCDEDKMLDAFIKRKLNQCEIDFDAMGRELPKKLLNRKILLDVIFSILLFVYICLIFFHFPNYTYIIGLIILAIFFIFSRKYNTINFLKKEIKSRPDENITNVIMNVNSSFVKDISNTILIILSIVAIIVPLIMFRNPIILYEEAKGGYAVRYYIYGLTNYETAKIPAEHNGKKVVSLRGNTFSNMKHLKSVKLPDTITEIRGQAFKNCYELVEVNIPKNLKYLGGGSFYNCISLESIELPDTITKMGGETFYNASNLKTVKLPNNLKEIRGDSFSNCRSLESITIPDTVTRIGGHAFEGCQSLSTVLVSENSKLKEIGSSAFRSCMNLKEITIPSDTEVNMRSFKNSPTAIYRYENNTDYNKEDTTTVPLKYMNYKIISKGEEILITENNEKIQYGSKIKLINVRNDDANMYNYIYDYEYIPLNGEPILFTISKEHKEAVINENITVLVKDNNALKDSYKGYIYIYYN